MKEMKNTKELGYAQIFLYREKDKYIGVCLELDIVDEADSYEELRARMFRSVVSYVSYAVKKGLDESLLNRPAPDKYWKMYRNYLANSQKSQGKNIFTKSAARGSSNGKIESGYEAGVEKVSLARACFASV